MDRGTSPLRDWIALLRRRWVTGASAAATVAAGLGAALLFVTARYTAEAAYDTTRQSPLAPVLASVIDKPASERLITDDAVLHAFDGDELVGEILISADRPGDEESRLRERDRSALRSALSIAQAGDGRFTIRAEAGDEEEARLLARAAGRALDRIVNRRLQLQIGAAGDTIEVQHTEAVNNLRATNAALDALKKSVGMLPGDADVEAAVARLNREIADRGAEIAAARETEDRLQRILQQAESDPAALALGAPDDERIADVLAQRRLAAETLAQLRRRYEDEYLEVKKAIAELERLDGVLASTRRDACTETLRRAQERASVLDGEIKQREAATAAVLGEKRVEVQRHITTSRRQEEQAERLAATQRDLDLEANLVAQYSFVARDVRSQTVYAWWRMIGLVLLAALAAGVGASHAREALDTAVRDPAHVARHAKLDVLATVPVITDEDINLADVERPSGHAEVYARLGTIIVKKMEVVSGKVLSVTSASAGEGKSTVASNLAVALARLGKKTILVDADLRNPRQHDYFRVDNRTGLSSLLERKESARAFLDTLAGEVPVERPPDDLTIGDLRALAALGQEPPPAELVTGGPIPDLPREEIARVIVNAEVENLSLLPSGPGPTNTGGLLEAAWFDALLEYLKSQYAYVVIDTPPVKGCADAMIVGRKTDATLLVVRAGLARRDDIRGTRRYLEEAGATLIGAVLNFNGDLEVAYAAREAA